MTNREKWSGSIAISLFAAIVVGSMHVRHMNETSARQPMRADVVAPQINDAQIADALHRANVPTGALTVHNVDGIVLVQGTADETTTRNAIAVINGLGFTRVANLVHVQSFDDENIRRAAERQLAQTRSLDGCMLKVSCSRGVIHVSGTIQNELQQDIARNVLRGVEGAHAVQVELKRL
jgi:osmotically-inducible protein OsmY